MPTPTSPKTYDELIGLVRHNIKQASIDATDPAEKGTVAPAKTDGDDAAKMQLASKGSPLAPAKEQLTDRTTHPAGTGENAEPMPASGDAKDKSVSSPTDPLSKIATDASSIAARIRGLFKGAAAPATTEAAPAAPEATPAATEAAPAATEAAPAAPEATPAAPAETEPKSAATGEVAVELTPEFHLKLASAILSTQEGVDLALGLLRKQAGVEAAHELMSAALNMNAQYTEAAAQENELDSIMKSASAEDQAQIVKFAKVHDYCLRQIADPLEKVAFAQGAMDAAAMDESAAAGEPTLPGAEGGEPSPDEILQILQQMVASGELDEATAQQVLELLAQGMGGAEGGAPVPEEAAAEAAPEAAAEEVPEEVKAAAAILYGNKA